MDAGVVVAERFTLAVRLGVGMFGEVWRAYDQKLERDVALKVVHTARFRRPAARKAESDRLVAESRKLARVRSPHVVTVYDVGLATIGAAEEPYVVMELLEGTGLGAAIAARTDGPGDASRRHWTLRTALELARGI